MTAATSQLAPADLDAIQQMRQEFQEYKKLVQQTHQVQHQDHLYANVANIARLVLDHTEKAIQSYEHPTHPIFSLKSSRILAIGCAVMLVAQSVTGFVQAYYSASDECNANQTLRNFGFAFASVNTSFALASGVLQVIIAQAGNESGLIDFKESEVHNLKLLKKCLEQFLACHENPDEASLRAFAKSYQELSDGHQKKLGPKELWLFALAKGLPETNSLKGHFRSLLPQDMQEALSHEPSPPLILPPSLRERFLTTTQNTLHTVAATFTSLCSRARQPREDIEAAADAFPLDEPSSQPSSLVFGRQPIGSGSTFDLPSNGGRRSASLPTHPTERFAIETSRHSQSLPTLQETDSGTWQMPRERGERAGRTASDARLEQVTAFQPFASSSFQTSGQPSSHDIKKHAWEQLSLELGIPLRGFFLNESIVTPDGVTPMKLD